MSATIKIYRHIRYAFAARGGEPQLADYRHSAEGSPCAVARAISPLPPPLD